MDVSFSVEQRAFREEVRTWLGENAPREARPHGGRAIRDYDLAWGPVSPGRRSTAAVAER